MYQIAIMGFGTIGSGVFELVRENKEVLKRHTGDDVNVKYVLDIRQFPGQPVEEVLTNDVNDILNNFTEEELAIILSDTIDENVSDDEYLQLQAKYQSQFCPKKVDHITTWMGSEVSGSAYIMYYEIKKNYQAIDKDVLRNNILTQINRGNVLTIRLARSHRNMVLRYTDSKSGDYFDIVIDNNELKAA
jgi:hypothetical protein